MSEVRFAHPEHSRKRFISLLIVYSIIASGTILTRASGEGPSAPLPSQSLIENPFVVTQIPIRREFEQQQLAAGGMLRTDYGDGARVVMVLPDRTTKVLSRGFYSASDPEISLDASHILFAGKRKPADNWDIFEMAIDGSAVRQVTESIGNCRSPGYQATLYTIVSDKPWYQLTFVGSETGALNEYGSTMATNLYSCKLDGSAVRRLTFNLSSDMDPFIMPDGRLLFASWQRSRLDRGFSGQVALFGINIDGTDYAAFSTHEGKRIKHMPCTTTKGLAVFVEGDSVPWDGSGSLGSVRLRRPLHSYRPLTKVSDGLFHSPSPLLNGRILVSRRSSDGDDTHGVYCLDPSNGELKLIFDDPDYHDIQAKAVHPRPEPDGRSSVVTEKDPHGRLYCLNVYISDLEKSEWLPAGTVKRLRVLEGIAVNGDTYMQQDERTLGVSVNGIPPVAQRRVLGEIDIEEDGSFNIEIPANTPIELQTLDAEGMALQSCSWIWAKNHEPRGCIGCHEDGELTPENTLAKSVTRPSIKLTLPPERRRTVDFRRDIMPIIAQKCIRCHTKADSPPHLTKDLSLVGGPGRGAYFNRTYESLLAPGNQPGHGKYVHPGRARTSPLIWHIFGRDTSRLWDDVHSTGQVSRMPPATAEGLTEDERRTFVEWIDMGALWDGIPGPDNLPGYKQNDGGRGK
ncbi:MAG: HzsA-related protein [Planctomycetota bacterium]